MDARLAILHRLIALPASAAVSSFFCVHRWQSSSSLRGGDDDDSADNTCPGGDDYSVVPDPVSSSGSAFQ